MLSAGRSTLMQVKRYGFESRLGAMKFWKLWHLWAKALGEKASKSKREADAVALIRTIIFLSYLGTNLFICAGVIRHWNDVDESRVPLNCQGKPLGERWLQ